MYCGELNDLYTGKTLISNCIWYQKTVFLLVKVRNQNSKAAGGVAQRIIAAAEDKLAKYTEIGCTVREDGTA